MKKLSLAIALSFTIITNSLALETSNLKIIDDKNNIKAEYNIKIAEKAPDRAKGLMHVKKMPENQAMLFIWPNYGYRYMWMKNTYIPLDMLFIKDETIIGLHQKAIPHDLTSIGIDKETNKVLEINAGQIEQYNIKVGDKIKTGY